MITFPQDTRPLPAKGTYIEILNHDGTTYVAETQADLAALPAPLKAALAKRPTPAQRAKDDDLRALFEQKQALAERVAREAAFDAFVASDPEAQAIKARK